MSRPILKKANLAVFGSLLVIGTIIATLGSVSLPIGNKISNFWPGIVIQALGGLWFGPFGAAAGVVFPIFSNLIIGGSKAQILGFIPANIAQSYCPLMFYRIFQRRPQISNFSDFGFFVVFVCTLPMFIAGLLGPAALHLFGIKPFIPIQYPLEIYDWAIIHFRTLLLIGVPMMIWVAPKAIAVKIVEPYWPDQTDGRSYHFLSIKLFASMGLVTLFPLILIGIYQIGTMDKTGILRPNFLAIAINVAFFSLLVVSSILTDVIARPIEEIIEKIEELSKTHLLDVNFQNLESGQDRLTHVSRTIEDLFAKLRSYERTRAMQQLAAQVAHDIRSPLAALDSVIKDVSSLPEGKRILIRSAASRIRDIANHLIEKNREAVALAKGADDTAASATVVERMSVELLSSHLDPLITEKRLQFRSRIGVEIECHLDTASYGLFARMQPIEFKRVFSNLVNNAVEALGDDGAVKVELDSKENQILIRVCDNGKGIPPEILAKLGQRGETHGKPGGSGLGLYHAKTSVESWGGSFAIKSEVGKGTTATVILPLASPPKWFVSKLELPVGSTIVVLDDDNSIHQVWQGRFDSLRASGTRLDSRHFSTPDELRDWVGSYGTQAKSAVYLMDYELLGHKETGLSLIDELGLGGNAILVTSRFEEQAILEECLRLGARMIPKGLAGFVPIQLIIASVASGNLEIARSPLEAVLIDDDELTRALWESEAVTAGKTFKAYPDIKSFLVDIEKNAVLVPKDAALYVDVDLGGGINGESVAKELHRRGFKNIRLATGYDPSEFAEMSHVREVVGKNSPWG